MGFGISGGGPAPESFQKAMVFIDGTNLFYRLKSAGLKVSALSQLFEKHNFLVRRRSIARIYLYTIEQHLSKAKDFHGDQFLSGIRVVLGDGIETKDGDIKEKGVDALLVADMIYHAASRNCEYALVVTADTDFNYVLQRVEDFGCRSAVLSTCAEVPQRLRDACDDCYEITPEFLLQTGLAELSPDPTE